MMRYLGGKARHGEEIARIVRSKRFQHQTIWEPFCGACWVSQYLQPTPVICSDICEPLIELHRAIQRGTWEPPDYISETEYTNLYHQWKEGQCSPWIGFAGFACSWGGKWFAGYSRGEDRNFCREAKQSLLAKHKRLRHVDFACNNYRNIHPHNAVVYCDPPYRGTTGYSSEIFNTMLFWQTVRYWAQDNKVIISEYEAPPDFEIIWQADHFSMKGVDTKITTEKLFMLKE